MAAFGRLLGSEVRRETAGQGPPIYQLVCNFYNADSLQHPKEPLWMLRTPGMRLAAYPGNT